MSGRKLATIRIISELEPIEGADFIEIAKIDGWQVVIKKGEFNVNDKILYLEVDSWVPHELAPFLCKTKDPKEYMGIKGERLRTIKLKGALSQGLVLDPHKIMSHDQAHLLPIGTDMTERLNIQLYEKPVAACLAGQVRGSFPNHTPKTDAERVQNLLSYFNKYKDVDFEASLKIDGSSLTVYFKDNDFGVCSRNLDLKEDENNSYWKIVRKLNIEEKLRNYGKNISLQGELAGENIQKNPDKLKGHNLFIFNIYDMDNHRYLLPKERRELVEYLGLTHTPIISESIHPFKMSLEELLNFSNGKSINAEVREGIVYKSNNYTNNEIIMFKVINNIYLLKEKD